MHRSSLAPLVAIIASTVSAQVAPVVRDERKQHLPDLDVSLRPLLVDVDRDGDLDAITMVGASSQLRLWLNLGRLRFADVSASTMPELSSIMVLDADVDGDGDQDLISRFTAGPELLLNDGAGGFVQATAGRMPALTALTHGFAVGDVDGDGDPDAFASSRTQAWILRNDGGVFSAVALTAPGVASALVARLADVDRDLDLDLVVVSDTSTSVLRNDGSGQFAPLAGALPPLSFVEDLTLADVDRDGDVDLTVGHLVSAGAPRQLFLNDGSGRFTNVTASHLPPTSAATTKVIIARDIERDGDVDLLLGQNDFQSELLLNDGSGRFSLGDAGELRALLWPSPALGDLDGNGTLDILTARTHVLAGRQHGAFALVDPAAIEADADAVLAVADFTGDGDLDLVQALGQPGLDSGFVVKRNDGTGTFRPIYYTSGLPVGQSTLAAGDLDGDGDLDVVRKTAVSGDNGVLQTLRNNGSGNFAGMVGMVTLLGRPLALYLDDVDADGDRDAVDVSPTGVTMVVNDGSGTFKLGARTALVNVTHSDLFDYDRDGDGDLFVASSGLLTLLENQKGTFVDVTVQRFPTRPAAGVPRLTLLDNRVYLLLVGADVTAYLALGAGFTQLSFTYPLRTTILDARIIATGSSPFTRELVVQEGSAPAPSARILGFTGASLGDATRAVLGDAEFGNVMFAGDVDTDGDLDLIGERPARDKRLLRGRSKSLFTPYAALLGHDLEFRLRDGSVSAQNPAVVHVLLGTSMVRVPVPGFGILRVDLAGAIVLPPLVVPNDGALAFALRVPANVALQGATVVAQPFTTYLRSGASVLGAAVREAIR